MQLCNTLVAAKLAPGASEGPFTLENVQLATQVQQRAAAAKQRNYAELDESDADDGDAYEEEDDEESQEDEVYAFCCSCFNSVAH